MPSKLEVDGKTITYKIKFINSFRFMSKSLSNSADNLSEGFHNRKCKECDSYREYIGVKDENYILDVLIAEKKVQKSF